METFYTIWCPQSHKPITRKFQSASQAKKVREKLMSDPAIATYTDVNGIERPRDFYILANMSDAMLAMVIQTEEARDNHDH